ncbi:MAG: Mov34/MPN/PAD-1 family protein [Gemmataceae bacterium]|nr:Mov34/MPN/PAD-1 family protein [Gemmataceae bacterium]
MFQALVSTASRLLNQLNRAWFREHYPAREVVGPPPAQPRPYQHLERIVLTDEVSRTLFEEYALHREGMRGDEETGWVLLGVREVNEAVVLATLPAGAERQAGVAHVRFNSSAQAIASRIVRQWDRRLTMLGILHTHPGSLRHPSDGDYHGDSQWVGQLRGCEGVFGIGTADGDSAPGTAIAHQPQEHMQCLNELCLSWYTLREGDRHYRPLKAALTLGPDLARPLHSLWGTLERYAEQLDRLCRQQAGVTFRVVPGDGERSALAVDFKLAEPEEVLRLVLQGKEARYLLVRGDDLLAVDPDEERVDRGVYLLLAELAGQN